jgi:glutamate synthase domain-containing protein 3
MTGGVAYVRDYAQLNGDSVTIRPVPAEDGDGLRALIEEHHAHTGSRRAAELLSNWQTALRGFCQVVPAAVVAPAPAPSPAPEAAADAEPTEPATASQR